MNFKVSKTAYITRLISNFVDSWLRRYRRKRGTIISGVDLVDFGTDVEFSGDGLGGATVVVLQALAVFWDMKSNMEGGAEERCFAEQTASL